MRHIIATKKLKALSLVEVLVYLSLFAIVFTAIVLFVIGVRETNQRSEIHNQLYKSVLFMVHNLNEKSDLATSIVLDQSVLNNDTGKITLVVGGSNVSFERINNKLYYTEAGITSDLTDAEIIVNRFNIAAVYNSSDILVGYRCDMDFGTTRNTSLSTDIQTSFLIR